MAELKFQIGEAQIQNAIAVAIAESFSPERNAQVVRDVVRAHLNHKENSYDKETILSKTVGKIIREIAINEIQKIIQEQEPNIRNITRKTLGEQFTDSLLTQLKSQLSRKIISDISISATIEEE